MVLALVLGVVIGVTVVISTVLRMSEGKPEREPVVHVRPDRRAQRLDDAVAAVPGLRRAVELTANLASRRGALGSVERALRTADVPIRPAEMILAHVCALILAPCGIFLLTRSLMLAVFAALIVGATPLKTLKAACHADVAARTRAALRTSTSSFVETPQARQRTPRSRTFLAYSTPRSMCSRCW